jgi:hypothetical protein
VVRALAFTPNECTMHNAQWNHAPFFTFHFSLSPIASR